MFLTIKYPEKDKRTRQGLKKHIESFPEHFKETYKVSRMFRRAVNWLYLSNWTLNTDRNCIGYCDGRVKSIYLNDSLEPGAWLHIIVHEQSHAEDFEDGTLYLSTERSYSSENIFDIVIKFLDSEVKAYMRQYKFMLAEMPQKFYGFHCRTDLEGLKTKPLNEFVHALVLESFRIGPNLKPMNYLDFYITRLINDFKKAGYSVDEFGYMEKALVEQGAAQ